VKFFFFSYSFISLKNRKKKKNSALDGQPNNSVIKMKKNAKWAVYLQPKWTYDVSVTMGSQEDSTYNLNVIGSSTYVLARFFSPFLKLSLIFFPLLFSPSFLLNFFYSFSLK